MVNQSKNKFTMKTKYGAAVAPVIILAGGYLAWNFIRHRAWRKKDDSKRSSSDSGQGVAERGSDAKVENVGKKVSTGEEKGRRYLSRSVSMGTIHGGKVALQRLLDFHSYRANASAMKKVETEFQDLLSKEQPDFGLLQKAIVKMEMNGKEAEGVEILKKALDKAREEGKVHEAYEIEMLLVEMLIYKGDIEEASKCKCLEDKLMISDARRYLYKTMIDYLQGVPKKKVVEQFDEFRKIQSDFQWPSSSEEAEIDRLLTFDEFKKVMQSLKQEIEEGKKNASTRKP